MERSGNPALTRFKAGMIKNNMSEKMPATVTLNQEDNVSVSLIDLVPGDAIGNGVVVRGVSVPAATRSP